MMRATAARIIRQIFLAAGRAANPTQCFLGTGDTAAWPAWAFLITPSGPHSATNLRYLWTE